jgi:hypothetical protein
LHTDDESLDGFHDRQGRLMQGLVSSLTVWGRELSLAFSIVQLNGAAPFLLPGTDPAHTEDDTRGGLSHRHKIFSGERFVMSCVIAHKKPRSKRAEEACEDDITLSIRILYGELSAPVS